MIKINFQTSNPTLVLTQSNQVITRVCPFLTLVRNPHTPTPLVLRKSFACSSHNGCHVKHQDTEKIILKVFLKDELYVFNPTCSSYVFNVNYTTMKFTLFLWHFWVGHASYHNVHKVLENNHIDVSHNNHQCKIKYQKTNIKNDW